MVADHQYGDLGSILWIQELVGPDDVVVQEYMLKAAGPIARKLYNHICSLIHRAGLCWTSSQ